MSHKDKAITLFRNIDESKLIKLLSTDLSFNLVMQDVLKSCQKEKTLEEKLVKAGFKLVHGNTYKKDKIWVTHTDSIFVGEEGALYNTLIFPFNADHDEIFEAIDFMEKHIKKYSKE